MARTTTSHRTAGHRTGVAAARTSVPAPVKGGGYRLPLIGTTLPSGPVETGFWGVLLGAAVFGAVDPPLAALVGAGVFVARHRRS